MNIEILLEKVKPIKFKYENELYDKDYNFNIFSILRSSSDEVYLHSKFICELLSPNGSHGKGSVFLKLFLGYLKENDFEISNVNVINEYKKIDIYISNDKSQSLIIENKIYANDQNKQLERYYYKIKKENIKHIKILYLTLYGDDPSKQSVGKLADEDIIIECISYETVIDNWLEKCIKEVALSPILRETLTQYKRLVQQLTGKSISKGYIMDIKDILINEENLNIATAISQALVEAKVEVQLLFWKELASQIKEKGYSIIPLALYSKEKVTAYYKKTRNNTGYGIIFELFNYDENSSFFYFIKLNHSIHHGFRYMKNNSSSMELKPEEKIYCLSEVVSDIDSTFERSKWWLGWKYSNPKINFKTFNSTEVFALSNPEKRKNYVSSLVEDIEDMIEKFKTAYQRCQKIS